MAVCKCIMKKNDCSCSKDKKIPKIEKKFLSEQRNKRSMIIGNVDQTNTARNVKKYFRNMPSSGTLAHESSNATNAYSSSSESADVSYDNYEPEPLTLKQNRFKLPSLAIASPYY